MGDPGNEREQRLKEVLVRLGFRYRDVDGQRGCSCTLQTQGDQPLPRTAYQCPISGTRNDGLSPVPTDVGQGDDWLRVGTGDEVGTQRDDLSRETIYRL